MRGPRRQWYRWESWKQDSGNVGCKVPEDHRGDAKRAAGCTAERSELERQEEPSASGGKSGVCGGAHLEAGVRGEACRLVPAGRVGVQRRNLPRRPGHQASRDLQMVGNGADRVKPLSLRFSSP